MKVNECDIVFISYDEPNAEENFLDLKKKFPKALRVHGVRGFDESHKQAAALASSESFFIVDGDNKITYDFVDLDLVDYDPRYIYSWASKNIVNGLIYGNGGIKLWTKKHFLELCCHSAGEVDWCFSVPYFQMNDWYSYSFCNSSPFQAFRTGFREGVKFGLDIHGKKIPNLISSIHLLPESTLRRLLVWLTVGEDVVNGAYAIYGARLGFLKILCENNFDHCLISDYEWFEGIWRDEFKFVKNGYFLEHYQQMAKDLTKILKLPVSDLNSMQSELMKMVMFNPKRYGPLVNRLEESEHFVNDSSANKNCGHIEKSTKQSLFKFNLFK